MNTSVINRQRKYMVDLKKIRRNAGNILSMCRAGDAELSILIVNNRFMRSLNRQYRGIDKPTDVLSFPPSPAHSAGIAGGMGGREPLRFLGDIVLSVEKIHTQAAERGHTPDTEFKVLLIHGILHLLGYDHEQSDKEARRMKRKERLILSGLLKS